jgi:uncharacterized protein (TIGR01777 family)
MTSSPPRAPQDEQRGIEPHTSSSSHAAITGATGLLGTALGDALRAKGWVVHRVTRRASPGGSDIAWDPDVGRIDAAALEGMDLVIHLAGEPIAQRWTAERKRRIRDSRIKGTTLLARALAALVSPPKALLSASAVGYYGDRGDEELDETSHAGTDFLAQVAQEWEAATTPASTSGIRVAFLRSGVVLTPDGGALGKMLPPFKLGVGGRLGSGKQWMSWIALHDWVRAVRFVANATNLSGPVNLVTPSPLRNTEFTQALARVLARPAIAPVPTFALELLFGEMARATLLASQRARPRRLLDAGFEFHHQSLEQALREELKKTGATI